MGLDPELAKILSSIEKRLAEIENIIFTEKPKFEKKKNDYSGLSGGIRQLVDNGFFDKPREMKEIIYELKAVGYHYPDPSTFKIISVDFIQKRKILSRLKIGRNYKYVKRK